MALFTEDQLRQLREVRNEHPDMAAFFDSFRAEFPGSKITYIKTDKVEFGTAVDPECIVVAPFIDVDKVAKEEAKKAKKQKPMTVGEKRRSRTQYQK